MKRVKRARVSVLLLFPAFGTGAFPTFSVCRLLCLFPASILPAYSFLVSPGSSIFHSLKCRTKVIPLPSFSSLIP